MKTKMMTTATIYWDETVIGNEGWAYATQVDGEHDATGPLKTYTMDALPVDAGDSDLVAALRDTMTVNIADDNITITR